MNSEIYIQLFYVHAGNSKPRSAGLYNRCFTDQTIDQGGQMKGSWTQTPGWSRSGYALINVNDVNTAYKSKTDVK